MLMEIDRAIRSTHLAMGTVMTHVTYGAHAERALAAVQFEIEQLEKLFSRFDPASDIGRINASAGVRSQAVSFETCQVLSKALAFSHCTEGCFDVSIGSLVDLWRRARETGAAPEADSIQNVLPLVDMRDLHLDPCEMSAGLGHAGQALDLGGIAKGFAGDCVRELYREHGITSAYSNLGGNVVTLGTKADGSAWRVGIQHPRRERSLIGAVEVNGRCVVTSGDYQRCFFDRQGRRYHHILDPRSGWPADAGLSSVTIVSDQQMAADVLSTALFVAGMQKGLPMLERFAHTEAVLVDLDMKVFVTRGLQGYFQPAEDINITFLA